MSLKENLRKRLLRDLPGWEAQKTMAPGGVSEHYRKVREDHKKASVVLLLYEKESEVQCIFIKRAEHPEDKHSGQISLPGGQLEQGEDYATAAIREVEEEIGIKPAQMDVLGALTPIYVFVSNFLVQPYVAWIDGDFELILQDDEVAGILTPKLDFFKVDEHRAVKDIEVRERILKEVPYFLMEGKVLWGATAMIMAEFAEMIKNIKG